ncbi:MAG: LytR C-terminal domain-containing protein [Acidimicrobiales bacterium]|nr:LytR C-terminal domain-containing protein [Acidimicrobiales bacterium]
MDRIERHDVLNAAMLAVILMGMTFTMLWGARGLVNSAGGDDEPGTTVLASGDDDSAPSSSETIPDESTTTTTTPATTTTTAPTTTTTAAVAHAPNEVKTRVGNGAERGGVAGAGTNILASAGYVTLAPKNAETIDVSTVYFTEGFSEDAKLVAQLLNVPVTNVFPMPSNPGMPVGDATVVAVLGRDTAVGS